MPIRLIAVLIALAGLAACLRTDPPLLRPEDIVQFPDLAGDYVATRTSTQSDGPSSIDARIENAEGGSYLVSFIEDGKPDDPTRLRLVQLHGDDYLAVLSEPQDAKDAQYGVATRAPDRSWSVKMINLKSGSRDDRLQAVVRRNGASAISFEDVKLAHTTDDMIHGPLTAPQLRALFTDPDFVSAMETSVSFDLTPKG
jgi:hypothetical protein